MFSKLFIVSVFILFLSSCKVEEITAAPHKVKLFWEVESDGAIYTVKASDNGQQYYPITTSIKDRDTVLIQTKASFFYLLVEEKNGAKYYSRIIHLNP